jgi:hypothetical protein
MKDGSFIFHVRDRLLGTTYNSRSLFAGILGFGWCTVLEKQLVLDRVNPVLRDCNLDMDVQFESPQKKLTARSGNLALTPTQQGYIVTSPSHAKYIFNLQGRLIEIHESLDIRLKLSYEKNGKLAQIHNLNDHKIWQATWTKDNRLATLSCSPQNRIVFKYKDDDLIALTDENADVKTETLYQYDSFHNLLTIRNNGEVERILTYDNDHDRVLSQVDTSHCLEVYQYFSETDLHFSSRVERHCGKLKPLTTTFEFWERELPQAYHILEKMRVSSGRSQRDYVFDPLLRSFKPKQQTGSKSPQLQTLGAIND